MPCRSHNYIRAIFLKVKIAQKKKKKVGDVLTELVVVGVEVEVALEVFVAHEVGEFPWDGEVAVARHFLARVDDARVVQARLPFFYFFSGTETGRYLMTVCISLNCKHRFSLLVLKIVSKKLLARFLKGK